MDVRYVNLKPIGRGAYGLVAAADDLLTGRKVRVQTSLIGVVSSAETDVCTGFVVLNVNYLATPELLLHSHHVAQVAIKRISRVFQDLIDAKRILREIKLLRHLGRHDNVIEILDLMTGPPDTEDFHTLYIVTQVRAI